MGRGGGDCSDIPFCAAVFSIVVAGSQAQLSAAAQVGDLVDFRATRGSLLDDAAGISRKWRDAALARFCTARRLAGCMVDVFCEKFKTAAVIAARRTETCGGHSAP